MKYYIKSAKSGLIFGTSALLIFVLGASVYAGWTSISKVKSSDTLKANEWNTMIDNMQYLDGRINGGLVIPTGLVSAFYLESCPTGWKPANGSNNTPDLRGKFIRGLNSFEAGQNKLTGDDSDIDGIIRTLGSFQNDAIRNLTGSIIDDGIENNSYLHALTGIKKPNINGVFDFTHSSNIDLDRGGNPGTNASINLFFDASRSIGEEHVGEDIRPKNVGLIYCVKE